MVWCRSQFSVMCYVSVECLKVNLVLFEGFYVPVQICLGFNASRAVEGVRINEVGGVKRKVRRFVNKKFLWGWC